MFVKTLTKSVRWMAVNLACTTMVFSPVAMGRESEKLNEKQLQSDLQEFGLTQKKITLGEFWEKTKAYYPTYVHDDLEKFVSENKNMLMPEITVATAKATDGSTVPVLRVTSGSKTNTIQIFEEKNKWAKYNNVVLSEEDMRNVDAVFKRIEASDIRLKKEADTYFHNRNEKTSKYAETMKKDFARFQGFPRMTPQQWKQMTPFQRAGYIVNMRLLWKDARQVLRIEEKLNAQKSSSKGRKFSSFEEFTKFLLGDEAEAAGNGLKKKTSQPDPVAKSVALPQKALTQEELDAKKCIVAGYVSNEGKGKSYNRTTCNEEFVFSSDKYKTLEMSAVREAKLECQNVSRNQVACNPIVYGYRDDGSAICVDRTKKAPSDGPEGNYQKATWWDGPCDSSRKLSDTQIQDNMKVADSSYADADKRYDEKGNLKADVAQKQIDVIEEDQSKSAFKRTQDYLDSVIKNKQKADKTKYDFTIADLIEGKKPWSQDVDDMLVDIQNQFESEIADGIRSCEQSITRKDNVDRNQKGACDQLHRRWLFTERFISQFRAKSCLGGSTYIWEIDQKKSSREQMEKVLLNKENKLSQDALLCACKNNPQVKIKFNDDKTCKLYNPPAGKCPEGMEEREKGLCGCAGVTESIPLNEALERASLEGVAKICAAKQEKQQCGKPDGIEGYDYQKCECTKGKLEDENEQGFLSKIFSGKKEKKEPKWVCKESDLLPWILGGFGVVALLAIFGKHSKSSPQKPPQSCSPKIGIYPNCVCAGTAACVPGQQVYDSSLCQCTNVPQSVICADGSNAPSNSSLACPKCADGSYRTTPTTGRPDGCPQSSEGGSGSSTCANPPCSGGIPGAGTGQ